MISPLLECPLNRSNKPPDTTQAGILWHVLAMMLFASMDAVSKHLVTALPVAEILWVRYVFFTVFGIVLTWQGRGIIALR